MSYYDYDWYFAETTKNTGGAVHKGYLKLDSDICGLEWKNGFFALATGDGGVGSWNLLCEYLENIYKMKK